MQTGQRTAWVFLVACLLVFGLSLDAGMWVMALAMGLFAVGATRALTRYYHVWPRARRH